jgi:hypothetical protein
MDTKLVVSQIIKQQESIIGPLAFDQARKVAGLQIASNGEIKISGNSKEVIGDLVEQYEHLFGQASIEVCKDAIKELKPPPAPEELPDILK